MERIRVLVVDDEVDFTKLVTAILEKEGFTVLVAYDGMSGIAMARQSLPDVIVMDWNMPRLDGIEACRQLRGDQKTAGIPVIMLTVRGGETDTVVGLEIGARDYIVKDALRPRELVARVKAAVREKTVAVAAEREFVCGAFRLVIQDQREYIHDTPIDLRQKEFELLYLLLKRKNHIVTRNFIAESVWGYQNLSTSRAIDTTVWRIRNKLGAYGSHIVAVKNIGYRYLDEEPTSSET